MDYVPFVAMGVPLLGLAVAWGSAKKNIAGNEKRIDTMEQDFKAFQREVRVAQETTIKEITVVQTKLDTLLERE